MDNRSNWLSQTPSFTTFRINRLRTFNTKLLETHLINIPKFYFLRPDCLIIEQWPAAVNLEKIDTKLKEVIVDAPCAIAVLRGAPVYAPAVLSLPTNCEIGERIDIYGDIEGHCKRGLKVEYHGNKKYVGTGYLKMTRSELFDNGVQPRGIAVQTLLPASRLPVVNESLYPKGDILLQHLPSIVCGWVVNAKPNEYILDMCSAPGNKTTHMAETSKNQAFITAIDKTPQKVNKIVANCEAHGITCVNAYVFDSTKCYSQYSESIEDGPPFPSNTFDKVLLDGPCSGLGQRPQLVNKMSNNMLKSYKFLQRKLFTAAVYVLKVGGFLVYSTCTITEDENEGMVAWVLENFPCLKLVPAVPLLGGPGLPNCGLQDVDRFMVQRFGPEDDPLRFVEPIYKETIGFFIAKFIKINNI